MSVEALPSADGHDRRFALRAQGLLAQFNRADVLTAADVHVATRLGTMLEESDEEVLLATALAVRAVRQGSTCLDLATVAERPLEDDPDTAELPWPDPAPWQAKVAASPVVAAAGSPASTTGCPVPRPVLARGAAGPRRPRRPRGTDGGSGRGCGRDRSPRGRPAGAARRTRPGLRRAAGPQRSPRPRPYHGAHRWPGHRQDHHGRGPAGAGGRAGRDDGRTAPGCGSRSGLRPARRRPAAAVGREDAGLPRWTAPGRRSPGVDADACSAGGPESNVRFRHHRGNPLPYDVVVVDETSMVSLSMMARLLRRCSPTRVWCWSATPVSSPRSRPARCSRTWSGVSAGAAVSGRRAPRPTASAEGSPGRAPALRDEDVDGVVEVFRRVARSQLVDPATSRDGGVPRASRSGADLAVRLAAGGRRRVGRRRARPAPAALRAPPGPYGVNGWNRQVERLLAAAPVVTHYDEWYAGRPVLVTANDYGPGLYNGDIGAMIRLVDGRPRVARSRCRGLQVFATTRLPGPDGLRDDRAQVAGLAGGRSGW